MGSILKESGIPADNIIFFDLDSKDYNKILKPEQLEQLIQSVPDVPGTKYLFIDEVQNVNGFETVLNGFRGTWLSPNHPAGKYVCETQIYTKPEKPEKIHRTDRNPHL